MRVILYDTVHFGPRCEVGRFDLADCFPEPDDYMDAWTALVTDGEYRCGGGAAPAMIVIPCPDGAA